MVTQNTSINASDIPQPTGNPLSWVKWWLAPRSDRRGERFRERVIRASVLILSLMLFAMFIVSTMYGAFNVEDFNVLIRRISLQASGWILILGVLASIYFKRYVIAGWLLIMIPSVAVLIFVGGVGHWSLLVAAFVVLVLVYGFVILPFSHFRFVVGLAIALSLTPLFIGATTEGYVTVDLPDYEIYFLPGFSVIALVIFIPIVSVLLFIIINELMARQLELQELVTTLEDRVQERTAELQLATEEAEKARAEAEEANQTKSQFLANMSHELRTPLNAILNFTAFVADGVMGEVNEEQEDMLRQSINSGNHLLSLINDILDITKIEAGLMDLFIQEVDINEVIGAVASVGKGLVKDKPQVRLNVSIEEGLPITYGDKRRLRQVFLNILSNAVKFTPEGEVTIMAKSIENGIHVAVSDTGIGIAPEDQSLVFESFRQAKHDIHEAIGTGLGMPISKYFVESHQGKMWLESEVDKGTTFYVELPILSEEEANKITIDASKQA